MKVRNLDWNVGFVVIDPQKAFKAIRLKDTVRESTSKIRTSGQLEKKKEIAA